MKNQSAKSKGRDLVTTQGQEGSDTRVMGILSGGGRTLVQFTGGGHLGFE